MTTTDSENTLQTVSAETGPESVNVRGPPAEGNSYDSWKSPLNPELYDVDYEFFSAQSGITDPEELKQHILKVQAEAYAVHPYPCIRIFSFAKTKIDRYPAYEQLLKLGKERPGALFLDIGCGVGNDSRRAVMDGFPASQAIASDLYADFWAIGHKLFRSTPESFPVKFLAGNIFEPTFLEPRPLVTTPPEEPLTPLPALTNLTPLLGRLSAIHASSFFHLFDEERQLNLAKLLASLLSPESGSIIFGAHGGRETKGLRVEAVQQGSKRSDVRMFCHSPESWKELWEDVFGGKDKVEVGATLREIQRKDLRVVNDVKYYFLVWSVKRL